MKPSGVRFTENCYPLVDARLAREDCIQGLLDLGFPNPSKSACFMCPYHSNATWLQLKRDHPDAYAAAVDFDRRVRKMGGWKELSGKAPKGACQSDVFVHRRMMPLEDAVAIDERQGNWIDDPDHHFGNDCEGMCGV